MLKGSCVEVLQRGRDVEGPLPSERAASDRRDDDRVSFRNYLRLDEKRKYQ